MALSKSLILVGFLFVVILIISSNVSARELAESAQTGALINISLSTKLEVNEISNLKTGDTNYCIIIMQIAEDGTQVDRHGGRRPWGHCRWPRCYKTESTRTEEEAVVETDSNKTRGGHKKGGKGNKNEGGHQKGDKGNKSGGGHKKCPKNRPHC
ncbi:hypothetical protein Adt_36786 [Abeliophyllum distichum]|uniref:Uncharacterized protein n=1 Tax=Abeliophyllum distichum TaxID=126358 RepID=A0ABD1QII9_9LAMI